jgi:hypothetical protein
MKKNTTDKAIGDFLPHFTLWTSHYFQIFSIIKNNLTKKNFPSFPIINRYKKDISKKNCNKFNILEFKEKKCVYLNLSISKKSDFCFNFYRIIENNLFSYNSNIKNKIIVILYIKYNFKKFQEYIQIFFRLNTKIKVFRKVKNIYLQIEII